MALMRWNNRPKLLTYQKDLYYNNDLLCRESFREDSARSKRQALKSWKFKIIFRILKIATLNPPSLALWSTWTIYLLFVVGLHRNIVRVFLFFLQVFVNVTVWKRSSNCLGLLLLSKPLFLLFIYWTQISVPAARDDTSCKCIFRFGVSLNSNEHPVWDFPQNSFV